MINEIENKKLIKPLLEQINKLAQKIKRKVNLMEVCGTHTQVIAEYGLKKILPSNVNLITGPGCPVCVTHQNDIDNIVELALQGVPIASYGDIMRVPGNKMSLDDARAKGAKIHTVYSVQESLDILKKEPELVFFAFGFETTIPMTVYAVQHGLSIYSVHKLFLPILQLLVEMKDINIDGFIGPGHVSVITGVNSYKIFKNINLVITGFELIDVLVGIKMLLKQIVEKRKDIENQYTRAVTPTGNKEAFNAIFEVFEPSIGNWRGFGEVENTGLELKKEFEHLNAKIKYKDILNNHVSSQGGLKQGGHSKESVINKKLLLCKCGEIVKGIISPHQCPLFGTDCNPSQPCGACMVSSEGACNVAFKYKK